MSIRDGAWSEARRLVQHEGWLRGGWEVGRRGLHLVKSLWIAKLLGAPGLRLGPGCRIHGARAIRLGRGVVARSNLWLEAVLYFEGESFEPVLEIGDAVGFSDACHIAAIGEVRIGRGVLFGSGILVTDHSHGVYSGSASSAPEVPPGRRPLSFRGPVVIEDNVWVGDKSTILGPARIGAGAVVAANSVVRGDVPPHTMVAGVPARVVRVYDAASRTWRSVRETDQG